MLINLSETETQDWILSAAARAASRADALELARRAGRRYVELRSCSGRTLCCLEVC